MTAVALLHQRGGLFGGFERGDIESLLEKLESNYMGWRAHGARDHGEPGNRTESGADHSFCRTDYRDRGSTRARHLLSDNRADLSRLQTPTECRHGDLIAPQASATT